MKAIFVTNRLGQRRLALIGVIAAGLLGQACAGGDAKPELGTESTEQALDSANATETVTLGFNLAASTSLSELVVAASDYMRLADRVTLSADSAVGNGNLEVGNDSRVGDLSATGNVTVGHRTVVAGSAIAGGTVKVESSTVVSGDQRSAAEVEPQNYLLWNVELPTTKQGDVALEPDQKRTVEPGKYANLSVKSRSTVTLKSGVYSFDWATLEPDATIVADDADGAIQIVVNSGFTFRGKIVSASGGIPKVLFAVRGTQDVYIERPFVGVVIAPNAGIHFNAATPEGHRAVAIGKSIWLEPDTKIEQLPFDWGTVLDPSYDAPPADAPVHILTEDVPGLTVNIPDGTSGPKTATASTTNSTCFTLPSEFTVEGGIIGNGTVVLRYGSGAANLSCTYRGQSSTSTPDTPDELTKGSLLKLEGCTDSLATDAQRCGTDFELEVNPVAGYPVMVDSPLERVGACADRMELLTSAQTREMRQGFDWSEAQPVADTNEDGTPTLYYAWVHIGTKEEALALKKLYIHVLSRPLFDSELMQFAGKCGSIENPGDGKGTFVPVVIPGKTYNKLLAAQTSDDVSGDRTIFDAVIIREVPEEARNTNGSINLTVLGQSGFRYLSYETDPFKAQDQMVLDGGGVSKALTDAMAWVGQAARDVGEVVTGILNEIDQLFRGEVTVKLWAYALTQDPLFKNDVMKRGWGKYAGQPLGASGMQVKILQRLFDSPLPSTAQGNTNINGYVSIDATDDADIRGRGICFELKTRAALVTNFLVAQEVCDFRAYDSLTSTAAQMDTFQLDTLTSNKNLVLHIDNTRLSGLYQSDDVFRYNKEVADHEVKRARILSGRWANTFTSTNSDGTKRLYAPCLNFPNSLSDAMLAAGAGAGALAGGAVGSVIPGVGSAVGAAVGMIGAGTFASVVGNTDIVMSAKSGLRNMRSVMSHEYGHYTFCDMLYDANSAAVDHVVWGTAIAGDEVNFPLRYTNEAMAEYFQGQVSSGADYGWLKEFRPSTDQFCSSSTTPCWERNLNANSDGYDNIGRVATMFLDAFDGQTAGRTAYVPTDADAWKDNGDYLKYSKTSDGHDDTNLEKAAISGKRIRDIAKYLAFGMKPFFQYNISDARFEEAGYAIDDAKIRGAVNYAMQQDGQSWCNRCEVLALHEPGLNINYCSATDPTCVDTVQDLWQACVSNGNLSSVVGSPPNADLRLDASTCKVCPDGYISDANGACVHCDNVIVGNTCQICNADVTLDATTMGFGYHFYPLATSGSSDNCPNVLTVDVINTQALPGAGADYLTATISTAIDSCELSYTISSYYTNAAGSGVDSTQTSIGDNPCNSENAGDGCLAICGNLPAKTLVATDLTGTSRFSAPNVDGADASLWVYAWYEQEPPQ